ncbi:hypothetical protein CKO12_04875 [Chromatium okenii]|uniref:hypothetical protein n=1 Tax=Chromatium okenii TaxID=61644 RepID=UPI0019062B5B|nr:hypothetical protein [Chromatium okenii]MBK1641217.1 hypothetical protein [Chromatium okenii]
MNIQALTSFTLLFGAAIIGTANAAEPVQFAAEMVSSGPDSAPTTGKMFVGAGRVRVELEQNGQQIVRISDQARRADWVLFPQHKGYLERSAPAGEVAPVPAPPSAEHDPCDGLQAVTCRRVGVDQVAGRAAVQWEMSVTREGKTLTGTQWLDVERGLPLKYAMPNGQAMELKQLGTETIAGRAVEKWEMTVTMPNQTPVRTLQWFDPVLKLAVREEFTGGNVRALQQITLGKQPDELFQIPADYTRLETPPAAQ